MRRPSCTIPHLTLLLASLLPAACGGGGSGSGGSAGFSNFDLLVTDAPADDLLAFQVTVQAARLELQGGGLSANLLAAPVALELLGLADSSAWLASRDVPAGTYSALQLEFLPGSYAARTNSGGGVAVVAGADTLSLPFATPLVVTDTGYRKVLVDLNLADSLSGDVAAPPLTFAPAGSAASSTSSSSIDEIRGTIATLDPAASTLVLDAFADDDALVPLGPVLVRVTPATMLLDDDGGTLADRAAFFAAVAPGGFLEVHGALVGGALTATRIEIEDNLFGGGAANLVKIEGLLLGIGPGQNLVLSIAEVEKGAGIVAAAFGGAIPATLTAQWDASTVFFVEEHQLTTSAALVVGQELKLKFAQFTNPPYVASRIEIEDENAENEGFVRDIGGLPTLIVRLDNDSPAILGGQVASTGTDVAVDLGGATLFLDTDDERSFRAADLLTGMKVEVRGPVAGIPGAPTIDATRVKVFLGRLDAALVTSANQAQARFTTAGGELDDPFGDSVTPGPLTVLLAPSCTFEGDLSSRAAFFAAFAGGGLSVRVHGIGTGNADEILAYEVRASVD